MTARFRLLAICKFAIPSPRALRFCVTQKKMLSHCWIVQGIIGHVLTHDGGCGGLAVVGGKSQMPSRKRWGRRVRLWEEASDAHWLGEWGSITCRNSGTLGKSTSMTLLSVLRVIEGGLVFSVSSFNLTSPEHLLSCCALMVWAVSLLLRLRSTRAVQNHLPALASPGCPPSTSA